MVYVLNRKGNPLMPTKRYGKVRRMLKEGKAKVISRNPFTIQLLYDTTEYTQQIILGIDSGYKHIGISAITDGKELYACEVKLRNDIVKLISNKSMYRRTRRCRKTRYRECRFLNRVKSKKKGWLAPSIQHKLNSHIRVIDKVKKILPISKIVIEVANFDIQKIKNPDISSEGYQEGDQLGFWNVREYVLHRDGHKCQACKGKSKDKILNVHHIKSRQTSGDRPGNLITLCETCHKKYHKGKIKLKVRMSKGFKAETFMSMVRWKLVNKLKDLGNDITHTYGYITKSNRIINNISKSHTNDAFVIAGGINQNRCKQYNIKQVRRHNRKLQLNRKGFKPSIRRQRYKIQPKDLVKFKNMFCTVKGMHGYGKYIYVVNDGKIFDTNIKNIRLVKYASGLCYK